jgi:V/A-type H+-transporting ATPase subunit I
MLEEVKRVNILAHESEGDLLERLQKLSILHITQFKSEDQDSDPPGPRSAEVEDLPALISKVEGTIRFLKESAPKEKGGIKGFIQDFFENKVEMSEADYNSFKEIDPNTIIQECDEKRKEIEALREGIGEREELIQSLSRFIGLDIPLEELDGHGDRYVARIGIMEGEIEEEDLYIEVLSEEGGKRYAFLIFPVGEPPETFQELHLDVKGTPTQAIEDLARERGELEQELVKINDELSKMDDRILALLAIRDHLGSELSRYRVEEDLARTERTFLVSGWVREEDLDKLKHFTGPVEVVVEEPDEDPPISFKNNKLVKPFELITRMFGPTGSIDPTPYLTPFFMLFFALCVGDLVYGILTIIFSILFLRLFKMGKDGKDLFHLLIYSSLLMIPIGLLTGSLLGDFFSSIEPIESWLNAIRVIDPSGLTNDMDAVTFLAFTVALGLIQVYTGYGIKLGYHSKSSLKDAILDEGVWIMFVTSAIVLLLYLADVMMFSGGLGVPSAIGIGFFLISLIILVLAKGRNERGLGKLKGLGSLYDLISIATDVLSYSRLFALSITTYLLAMAFNKLAGIFLDIPILGWVICAVVLVICHLFILFVSSIGAFVHTMRLQLLEFFTKFADSGGEFFSPFTKENKYVYVIKDGC